MRTGELGKSKCAHRLDRIMRNGLHQPCTEEQPWRNIHSFRNSSMPSTQKKEEGARRHTYILKKAIEAKDKPF